MAVISPSGWLKVKPPPSVIRPQVNSRHISHVIRLDGSQAAWGVTTSGVGGRSLTRGIASAVTVLAANASVADAAATAIGNACFVEDERYHSGCRLKVLTPTRILLDCR